jgi:2-oxo-4-hydroxy-4-carboxy--5-ureidoimidazoline (OHCU) decarboxylase
MTLEQTFFLSQTIAAAAVVISIIYLARQVNQAERVQRAIMQQRCADRSSKASLTTAHPELARIWQKKGVER